MRLIEFPRGRLVDVCYLCEREKVDEAELICIEELVLNLPIKLPKKRRRAKWAATELLH